MCAARALGANRGKAEAVSFDAAAVAKTLLREARSGALATLAGSDPYCSLVAVASAADGAPILLISGLAVHTRNIAADARVSLMLRDGGEGDPLQQPRIALQGRAVRDGAEEFRDRYLARHPGAAMYADFGDFGFYRVALSGAHLVAGFGRIVDLSAAELATPLAGAADLLAAETEICRHLNADHADTLRLYATRLLRAPDGAWRCVGCDPEGLELERDGIVRRLPFPQPVRTPGAMRARLKELADRARAAPAP